MTSQLHVPEPGAASQAAARWIDSQLRGKANDFMNDATLAEKTFLNTVLAWWGTNYSPDLRLGVLGIAEAFEDCLDRDGTAEDAQA